MAKHYPTTIFATHRTFKKPSGYVRTRNDGRVDIVCYSENGACQSITVLPRRVARLLARRINQCLDTTR